jgi:hypothetical protein
LNIYNYLLFNDLIVEEGDQLVSVQLEEQQKLKKNLENKKKKPIYTGYDDEEFNFGGGGIPKKNFLSHYDEEIEGDKRTVNIFNDLAMNHIIFISMLIIIK